MKPLMRGLICRIMMFGLKTVGSKSMQECLLFLWKFERWIKFLSKSMEDNFDSSNSVGTCSNLIYACIFFFYVVSKLFLEHSGIEDRPTYLEIPETIALSNLCHLYHVLSWTKTYIVLSSNLCCLNTMCYCKQKQTKCLFILISGCAQLTLPTTLNNA